ncbi:MAG: flagellar filament capping protein FliD [Deltaproteobacteria bacterium]|nr:flagellar filament capping protein FliD [Deltaproteobacteria bacterium]
MSTIQFTGLASGIDSKSLIDALVEARSVNNVKRRNDIDFLNSESDALEQLNTKLLALNDLVDQFRSSNGGGLKKKVTSANTEIATASAGSNAVNSSFSLTVNDLAQNASASFDESYTATTNYVSTSGSGNVTFTVGTGADQKTVTVAVTANSTTVGQFVDSINNAANSSGRLSATVINTETDSSPDYRIMISTLKQGTEEGQLAISADVGIIELQSDTLDASTNAKNASVSVTGISGAIERSNNTISDLIPGVTIQLVSEGATTISISDDTENTLDLMNQIVEAYNDIVDYVDENDFIDRKESGNKVALTYGTLAKTRVDDDFLFDFRSAISTAESANGTTATKMSELGISTNRDGTITLDEDTFKEAIAEDSVGAQELISDFADSIAGVDGLIYEYTKFQGTIDNAKEANDSEIKVLNDSINQLERTLEKYRETLQMQYSRLESTIGRMQSEGSSLSSAIQSLG